MSQKMAVPYEIRPALASELDELMELFDKGRRQMRESGNMAQWANGYPTREMIEDDLRRGELFVLCNEKTIYAVFVAKKGIEPDYVKIYDGKWLNEAPYISVHRLASSGLINNAADICLDWCLKKYGNIRIDTHETNAVMRHILEKNGYIYCGVIHIENGTPFIAFQNTVDKKLTLKENFFQFIKFAFFSCGAGIIQVLSFTLLNELLRLPYWPCYLTALVLSVLYNFTLNRRYTFKSAASIPIAMLQVALYYAVFTPLSTWAGEQLTLLGVNEYIVLAGTMITNFVTEFLFCRFVVYRKSINTAVTKSSGRKKRYDK